MRSNILVIIVGLAMAASAAMGQQRMTHYEALGHLQNNGISVVSTGRCSDKTKPSCTSLDDIRANTIWQLIAFKDLSGCPIVVTGGTETGHGNARVQCSHADGYKVDVRKQGNCIENFIRNSGRFGRPASTAWGELYTARSTGNKYLDEGDHWDICYV